MAVLRILFYAAFILLLFNYVTQTFAFKRICYLRQDKYFPIHLALRLDLCTHIIIGFFAIDSNCSVSGHKLLTDFCRSCKKAIDDENSNAKLMFSIGGGGAGGFELATSNDRNRKLFVSSIFAFIEKYQLDGVDIDWEFPSWGPNFFTKRFEKDNFVYLLRDLREKFEQHNRATNRQLILSTAVAGQLSIIYVSYKPMEIAKYVDFINLMTYDFSIYKWYQPFVGHNSALHPQSNSIGVHKTFNIDWAANFWSLQGVPKVQIMVGIPSYGKRFTLYSKYLNYPGALAVSGGSDCTYSDICDFLSLNNTEENFDQEAKVPYAYNEYEWISFENQLSASHKAQWIKQNGFGGVMIFSLNADDFRQKCTEGFFPIHSAIRAVLVT